MLVLSRRVGEKIIIGDGVTLTVKRIIGQRAILGIEAPRDMTIVRSELRIADQLAAQSDEVLPRPAAKPR